MTNPDMNTVTKKGEIRLKRGRPKKLGYSALDAMDRLRKRLPSLIEVIYARAIKGDRDCAVYLVDRVMGRPHQSVSQRLITPPQLTADDYELATRMIEAHLLLPPPESPLESLVEDETEIVEGEVVY